MKKTVALLISLILVFTLAVPVFAAGNGPQVGVSQQTLKVNGIVHKCEKYNIDGSNYFKLRDLAYLLSGTGSQFSVGWDAAANTVSIVTGKDYEWNGKELLLGQDASATAQKSAQTILIDGQIVTGLDVYNIGGSNYFKLRDLGDALGFDVGYDAETNTAIVTSRPVRFLESRYYETGTYSAYDYDEATDTWIEKSGIVTYETVNTYFADGKPESVIYTEAHDGEVVWGYTEVYDYDYAGNLAKVAYTQDGQTDITTYTYNEKGDVEKTAVAYSYGDREVTTYYYDAWGYVLQETTTSDWSAYSITYTYDANHNLLSEVGTYSDGDTWSEVYTYDAAGNCLTDAYTGAWGYSSSTTRTYDAAGHLLTENEVNDFGGGDVVTYVTTCTYDAAGNEIARSYETDSTWGGETTTSVSEVAYTYDASGKLLTETYSYSEGGSESWSYTYNAAGQMQTQVVTYSDGTTETYTYTYDEAGRQIEETDRSWDGETTVWTRVYDANGNLIQIARDGEPFVTWEYIELAG